MQSFSGLAASRAQEASRKNQRMHYRYPIQSLIYVTLDEGNGGIIRNLSQHGAAIQAVGALRPGQSIRMRFDLLDPKTRLDVHAHVTWASPSGQAGVRFLDLPRHSSRQLNDWIFVRLLGGLERSAPVFRVPGAADELLLSPSARPATRLPAIQVDQVLVSAAPETALSLSWWPRPVSPRALAKLMDGLVLFSAVLMFFCVFLAVAQTLPTWPIVILLGVGVSGFFTALYGFLGTWIGCGTAGVQLARIAIRQSEDASAREEQARFR